MDSSSTTATTANATSSLPRLVPVDMTPAVRSPSHQELSPETDPLVLGALARVERIEIQAVAAEDAGRKTGYEILVFFRPIASRIPVPITAMASPKQQKPDDPSVEPPKPQPDIVVSRSFSDFRRLRDAVYYPAHRGHDGSDSTLRSCVFCASVVDMVLSDQGQPHRFHEWLYSSPAVCSLLEGFCKQLFDRALGSAAASAHGDRRLQALARAVCPVQTTARRLMAEFLGVNADNQ